MVWNTHYLGTPHGANAYNSTQTTVLSDLSIAGTLDVGAIKLNAQPAMTLVSASSTSIVATTCVATKSTTTNYTDNAVAAGDLVIVGPSALSAGVDLTAVASAASTIQFRYSNVSTVNAAQVEINCRYQAWRF